MRFAIMSDIHDHIWNLHTALHWLLSLPPNETIDELICCGDLCSPFVMGLLIGYCKERPVPIHVVFGNNDADTSRITAQVKDRPFVNIHNEFAELAVVEDKLHTRASLQDVAGKDSYFDTANISHRVAVNHFDNIARPIAASGGYHLVCFGHNHRYEVTRLSNKTLALNPGTLMGYNPVTAKDVDATFAIYDTSALPAHQFYRVVTPWQGADTPGEVVPYNVPETSVKA